MLRDPSGYGPIDWGGNPAPDIAKTPGEAGRTGIINFANTHYVQAEKDGVRYRVQIHATNAEWVGTGEDAHWIITDWEVVSATPIPEGEEPEQDESGYEPIAQGGTSPDAAGDGTNPDQTTGNGVGVGSGAGTGSGAGDAAGGDSPDSLPGGSAASVTAAGTERFIWNYEFSGGLGGASQRGFILQNLYLNNPNVMQRDNVPRFDNETSTKVQQIKSMDSTNTRTIRSTVSEATKAAGEAVTANRTGTMTGKSPQAVIITPTDAPASVGTEINQGFQRMRNPPANALPPEHVRGLPGAAGALGKGLTVGGTAFSAYGLYNDIKNGDVPMGIADTLGVAGGSLEIYALAAPTATIAGASVMSVGLVVGGAGIAIGSGIGAYRAYQRGDTAGVVAGVVGVAAGLAIMAGVIFGAPLLLAAGIIGAIGVGLFHLGRWLFGD